MSGALGTLLLPLASSGTSEGAVLGILVGVSALLLLAHLTTIPYPIWLTVGGAALAFVPGLPEIRLEPDLILIAILPPLLYTAAFFSDLRELRRNAKPIGLLAVGLVLATTFGIAAIAHAIVPGLPWSSAIVLGAVLGPTDPVAATAIATRVGVPHRVVAVLEGESLVNDATALITFKFAVTAATAGSFSFGEAFGMFVLGVVGGVAVGLAVGWVVAEIRRRVDDMPTEALLSIATAYFAYLPAELLGVSGVIAAVTAGVYLGLRAPQLMNGNVRISVYGLWTVITFGLNGLLFVLVGLQLPLVLDELRGRDPGALAVEAVAVAVGVMAIRFLWVFGLEYVPRLLNPRTSIGVPGCETADGAAKKKLKDPLLARDWRATTDDDAPPGLRRALRDMRRRRDREAAAQPPAMNSGFPAQGRSWRAAETQDPRAVFVVAFTGMRGAVSLAAALAVPEDVVGRDVIVFLCFTTILWTVCGQGLTLPTIIRRLGLTEDGHAAREEEKARLLIAEAAITAIGDIREAEWVREDTADRVSGLYEFRRRRFKARLGHADEIEPDIDGRSLAYQRLAHMVFDAQRAELVRLRSAALIGDDTMRRIERDIDLEEERLDA